MEEFYRRGVQFYNQLPSNLRQQFEASSREPFRRFGSLNYDSDRKRAKLIDDSYEPNQGVTRLEYEQTPLQITKRPRTHLIEPITPGTHYYKPTNRVFDFKMRKYGRIKRYTRRARRSSRRYPRKMVTRRMPPALQRRTFVSTGVGFPRQLKMIHRWASNYTLTTTGGALVAMQVKANSIYRPGDSFSVTTEPMFYDQLTPLYDHWTVIGSKIKVTLVPPGAVAGNVRWGIYLNDDSSLTPATIEGCITQGTSVSKVTTSTSAGVSGTLYSRYSAKKEFGGSILANNAQQGGITSNPSEIQYWTIFAQPTDAVSSVGWIVFVECEYITVWKEAKDISMS